MSGRGAPTATPTNGGQTPAAWYPDPAERHDHRYWDGAAWTDDVSDGGVVGVDPLLTPTPPLTREGPPRGGLPKGVLIAAVAVVAVLTGLGAIGLASSGDDPSPVTRSTPEPVDDSLLPPPAPPVDAASCEVYARTLSVPGAQVGGVQTSYLTLTFQCETADGQVVAQTDGTLRVESNEDAATLEQTTERLEALQALTQDLEELGYRLTGFGPGDDWWSFLFEYGDDESSSPTEPPPTPPTPSPPTEPPPPDEAGIDPWVNMANFERIQEGMTMPEVEAILGGPGELRAESTYFGDEYVWKTEGPATDSGEPGTIIVTFKDGVAYSMSASEGLP